VASREDHARETLHVANRDACKGRVLCSTFNIYVGIRQETCRMGLAALRSHRRRICDTPFWLRR
jgi:hypothetical protein